MRKRTALVLFVLTLAPMGVLAKSIDIAPAVTPAVAVTPADAATGTDAANTVQVQVEALITAAQNGEWAIAFGFALLLLVAFADKAVNIKGRVGKAAMPWVVAGLGVLSNMGIAAANGEDLKSAFIYGASAGLSAIGMWEMLGKHFLKKKAK